MSQHSTAIVIGAGIAGIATAIRLAVQGLQVQVYEQNSYPGGKLSAFELASYRFDAGPSLFTQPENIRELFALAEEPMEDYFDYMEVPIACKYFFEDGIIVNGYTNKTQLAEELAQKLGENPERITQYLAASANTYNNIGQLFLQHSLHKTNTLFQAGIGKAIKATKPWHLFKTMHQVNTANFSNAKTIQMFNRYATYNGSNPYKAPGMLTLIPHLEYNIGTFYPKGGMIRITQALYELALKKGVQFHFNSPVQRIIQHNGKVEGVVVHNENKYAPIVVSNMDVYFTYKNLLNNPIKSKRILQQERSSSAFIFYWGINRSFEQLELHNIFFSKQYQAEFDALFKQKTFFADPTVYVNITSKCEPGTQAPLGKENWFVMVNAPANIGQNWQQLQQQYKQAIIQKLSKLLQTNIEDHIEVEEVLSPVLIEQKTSSYMGSLYGTSSNSKMAAFLRHPNFSKKIQGLYFVGGSVHPGGGIPLCLHSAKITSKLISNDLPKIHQH